jgi:hypothetical protein
LKREAGIITKKEKSKNSVLFASLKMAMLKFVKMPMGRQKRRKDLKYESS